MKEPHISFYLGLLNLFNAGQCQSPKASLRMEVSALGLEGIANSGHMNDKQ